MTLPDHKRRRMLELLGEKVMNRRKANHASARQRPHRTKRIKSG